MRLEGNAIGQHLLIDLYDAKELTETQNIERTLIEAAEACGATVLGVNLHKFGEGQGVTGVALLSESHISIHTWPEWGFAAIDIFMCGDCNPEMAISTFESAFSPMKISISRHSRGTVITQRLHGSESNNCDETANFCR